MRGVCSLPNPDPLILWHWAMCLYSSSTGTDWMWEFSISSRLTDGEPTSIWHRWRKRYWHYQVNLRLPNVVSVTDLFTWIFYIPHPLVTLHFSPCVCSPLWADSTFISPLPVAISFYLEAIDVNLSAKSATYLSVWAAVLQSGPCAAVSQKRSHVEVLAVCHSPAGKATYGDIDLHALLTLISHHVNAGIVNHAG